MAQPEMPGARLAKAELLLVSLLTARERKQHGEQLVGLLVGKGRAKQLYLCDGGKRDCWGSARPWPSYVFGPVWPCRSVAGHLARGVSGAKATRALPKTR